MLISLQSGTKSPMRVGELKTSISGIALKMLTVTLRQLGQDGFVHRVYFPVFFYRVEYSITSLSKSLMDALNQPVKWANKIWPSYLLQEKNLQGML